MQTDIRKTISELRATGATNEKLIDEAIRLCFMMLGENPTQARILDLVRVPAKFDQQGSSPSAATVQKRIAHFWATIRSRLGATLEHPEIPADVLAQFSQGITGLWNAAVAGALASLNARQLELEQEYAEKRREADVLVATAQSSEQAAKESAALANAAAAVDRQRLEEMTNEKAALAGELEASKSTVAALTNQVEALTQQVAQRAAELATAHDNHRKAMEQAASAHESKLESIRQLARQAEDKAAAENRRLSDLLQTLENTTQRLRLDVDREVSRSEGYRKELAAQRESRFEFERTTATAARLLNEKIAALSTENGNLEGRVSLLSDEVARLQADAQASQRLLGASDARLDRLKGIVMAHCAELDQQATAAPQSPAAAQFKKSVDELRAAIE